MAWNADNLFMAASGVSGGPNQWIYRDTVVHTALDADDYLATAVLHGMKVGDVITYQKTDGAYATTIHSCRAVSGDAASASVAIFA